MPEEKQDHLVQEREKKGQWLTDVSSMQPMGNMQQASVESDGNTREEDGYLVQPLTPLSFDTLLTAGDIKRILKIVSVG